MKWLAERLLGKAMWFSVGAMALVAIDGHAVGQCVEDQKLLAFGDGEVVAFGASVSISGNSENKVAIVGSPGGLLFPFRLGAAFIYRFNGVSWVEEAKLLASDGRIRHRFGGSVSISGTPGNEVVIVGSSSGDGRFQRTGSAYIYRFNGVGWVEEQKLFASDGFELDGFGTSVSISGTPGNEVAIFGAPFGDGLSPLSGAVYIYRFNGVNWVEEAKLFASDGAIRDGFGWTVSISGTTGNEVAIVGVRDFNINATNPGSAYIYRFNGVSWVEEQKLLASDGEVGDVFGWSVSLSGTPGNEIVIVGALGDDDNGPVSGSAYIYRFNGVNWVEEQKLLAFDGAASDIFGYSVSIGGTPGNEVAIVAALRDDDNGTNSGSAYIYRFNGVRWVEAQKLLASGGVARDFFGYSVSITGAPGNEAAIVGAPQVDHIGLNSGSAYIYELPCGPACPADLNYDRIVDMFDLFRVIHALFTRGEVAEDLDGDGVVTFRDVHIVIQSFGTCDDSNPASCPADLNGDGIVDVPDLLLLLGNWGLCPAPCPSDLNGDGAVNVSDFLQLLAAWGPCP